MDIEFDQDAIRKMYEDIANKIKATDKELRQKWTGHPVESVLPAAKDAFGKIGLELPDEEWHAYAASVASDENFTFELE